MKQKDKSLEVNEYRIKFIYDNPNNVHTRYFQSVSSNQITENLNKVIISGGSKGIGFDLVKHYLSYGFKVFCC